MTAGWGYGSAYYNPYYAPASGGAVTSYDYSQPVVVNNYVTEDPDGQADPQPVAQTPAEEQAVKLFDSGLAQFKAGQYRQALTSFDSALQKLPGDPVVHEVRALTLFALGQYKPAAAALNSFLSSAPGMDWTTMSSLYGNVDDYQAQLRKLEEYSRSNPNDPASHFVLAYQYLVTGSTADAMDALKVVVKNQPKDATAKRMLDALTASEQPPTPGPAAPSTEAPNLDSPPADEPQTDLVGTWRAKAGDATIDLAITEDSQFSWKANQKGKPAVELKGEVQAGSNELVLESKDQGAMAGTVKSLGADKWQFALDGAPPTDPGLTFARVK